MAVQRYDDLSFTEFDRLRDERTVALWPIGIVEEHGPHLPLATDALQAEWDCDRLAAAPGTLLLPPLRYGNATATATFPGTITLRFDTVRAVARDVLSELGRNGVRKAMVVSGHLGADHMRALRLGAKEALDERPGLRVVVMSDWEVVYELRGDPAPLGEHAKLVPPDDGHAGTLETARMLAIAPHLCHMARAPPPAPRPPSVPFEVTGGADKEFPSGVLGGDATRATAEMGHEVNRFVMKRLDEILRALQSA